VDPAIPLVAPADRRLTAYITVDQRRRVRRRVTGDRDTDARTDSRGLTGQLERLPHRGRQFLGSRPHHRLVRDVGQNGGELVAPEAAEA
jgi:hypothetical protein